MTREGGPADSGGNAQSDARRSDAAVAMTVRQTGLDKAALEMAGEGAVAVETVTK